MKAAMEPGAESRDGEEEEEGGEGGKKHIHGEL